MPGTENGVRKCQRSRLVPPCVRLWVPLHPLAPVHEDRPCGGGAGGPRSGAAFRSNWALQLVAVFPGVLATVSWYVITPALCQSTLLIPRKWAEPHGEQHAHQGPPLRTSCPFAISLAPFACFLSDLIYPRAADCSL